MTRGDNPLLVAGQDDGDSIDGQHDAEDDALLSGRRKIRGKTSWTIWRETAAFLWAFVATVAVVVLAVLCQHQKVTEFRPSQSLDSVSLSGKKNLIFMVSDGMGPASLSLTRSFRQNITGLPVNDVLVLDQHLIGQSRTRSSSSLVTDSAAGATAFSCGRKSYNGAISVLPNHKPCGTVLEAAKRAGYLTGLVVTTRITDATPACFAAHVNLRIEEDSIARQLIGEHPLGHVVDLMLGGGECHFLPRDTKGSCRKDDVNVIEKAKENGYTFLNTRDDFDRLNGGEDVRLPLLGLFSPTDIPYEIDRRVQASRYPSLEEMASVALRALQSASADSDKGFFLMIEGSRIDHAGHGNDPAAQVHEVLAYDKAFNSVLAFLERNDTDGVIVATSDHETGGLAIARQLHESYPEYRWFPGVLANASHSSEHLAMELKNHQTVTGQGDKELESFILDLVQNGLGVSDVTEDEVANLAKAKDNSQMAAYIFADIISRRAQTGWSTHGHSGVDVNIYSSNPALTAPLLGNHENTDVGAFLANFLDVNVDDVTKELQKKEKTFAFDGNQVESWLGQSLNFSMSEEEGLHTYDHYDGDFRKREILGCGCGVH